MRLALVALLLAACSKPAAPRPVPDFRAHRLDGSALRRSALEGRPYVVTFFVPD